ncbi:MAG: hypothetical protein HY894_09405 [Deltaproteobacteria bacterium]|nr:hypothetical protein [Deltaproteobacteria bacterium]
MSSKIIRDGKDDAVAEPLRVEPFGEPGPVQAAPGAASNGSAGMVGDEGGVERAAYEEGFKAGEAAGFAIGAQKAAIASAAIAKVLGEVAGLRDSLYLAAEAEMTGLALAIARKVIQREIETSPEAVMGAVRAAVDAITAGREITMKVNPKDLETVRRHSPEIDAWSGTRPVRLAGDEAVSRGGCVIETNLQEADATVDGCLAAIEERLEHGRR